jgi:hypothetical protein
MSLTAIKKLPNRVAAGASAAGGPKRYIFVLSHMRSYSSLLSHILGSHPDIRGAGEMHQRYTSRKHLLKLRYRTAVVTDDRQRRRYVLDKSLHDHYPISSSILQRDDVALIFLLRQPVPTVRSIINLGNHKSRPSSTAPYTDMDWITGYYTARLTNLANYACCKQAGSVFLDSERLLNDTHRVLHNLSTWLGLTTDLIPTYSIFPATGKTGYGDSLDRIYKGTVVHEPKDHHHISVPPRARETVASSYLHCREVLSENCRVI